MIVGPAVHGTAAPADEVPADDDGPANGIAAEASFVALAADESFDGLDDIEPWLGDLDRPFPWDEIEWNRCALQLSTQTGLDEIHSLFSFMAIGQVWITSAGKLQGVVTDRALISTCLHGEEEQQ